jgi:hypothetical protein
MAQHRQEVREYSCVPHHKLAFLAVLDPQTLRVLKSRPRPLIHPAYYLVQQKNRLAQCHLSVLKNEMRELMRTSSMSTSTIS